MAKLIAKITLLLVALIVGLFPSLVVIFSVFMEDQRFEPSMLIAFGFSILGICSTIFHGKTVSFYKNLYRDEILKRPDNLFLGLNLGFAASNILFGLFFLYLLYFRFPESNSSIDDSINLIIAIPVLLGSLLFAETFYMRKKLNDNKEKVALSEIENIKGNPED